MFGCSLSNCESSGSVSVTSNMSSLSESTLAGWSILLLADSSSWSPDVNWFNSFKFSIMFGCSWSNSEFGSSVCMTSWLSWTYSNVSDFWWIVTWSDVNGFNSFTFSFMFGSSLSNCESSGSMSITSNMSSLSESTFPGWSILLLAESCSWSPDVNWFNSSTFSFTFGCSLSDCASSSSVFMTSNMSSTLAG